MYRQPAAALVRVPHVNGSRAFSDSIPLHDVDNICAFEKDLEQKTGQLPNNVWGRAGCVPSTVSTLLDAASC